MLGWLEAKFEGPNKQFLLRPKTTVGKPPQQEEAKKEISEMKEAQIKTNELLGEIAAWLKRTAPGNADTDEHSKKQNDPRTQIHKHKDESSPSKSPAKPTIVSNNKVNQRYKIVQPPTSEIQVERPNIEQAETEEDWDSPTGYVQYEKQKPADDMEDGELTRSKNGDESVNAAQTALTDKARKHLFTRGFETPTKSSTPNDEVKTKVSHANAEVSTINVSNIGISEITKLIVKEVQNSLKNNQTVSSSFASARDSSRISVEVSHNESNVQRRYSLNKKLRFETFENYLFTELKSRKLFYVLDEKESAKVDKEIREYDETKVKNIIINHLSTDYDDEFTHLNKPKELLEQIKEVKLADIGLDEHSAFKRLINIRFDPKKETANEYCARFEKTVRTYDIHSKTEKFSEDNKRKLFFHSVEKALPQVVTADCVSMTAKGTKCDYKVLKKLVLQVGPKKVLHVTSSAMHASGGDSKCYKCSVHGHNQYECPKESRCCYTCGSDKHLKYDCPKSKKQERWRAPVKRANDSSGSSSRPEEPVEKKPRPRYTGQPSAPYRGGSSAMSRGRNRGPVSTARYSRQGTKKPKSKRVSANLVEDSNRSNSESDSEDKDEENELNSFIADSGATEHIANT